MAALSIRTIAIRGGVAAVVAAAGNALLVALSSTLALAPGFAHIAYGRVVVFTVIGVAAATVVFAALVRSRPNPRPAFRKLAAAALLVSFVPDVGLLFSDPAATPAGVVVLMLMHVVAAAAAVWALTRGLAVPDA